MRMLQRRDTGVAALHVLPSSVLELTTIERLAAFERLRVHATYTRPELSSTAMRGASSKPYFHVGCATRTSGSHRALRVARVVTTRYGVSESPQYCEARNARYSRPSRRTRRSVRRARTSRPGRPGRSCASSVVPPFGGLVDADDLEAGVVRRAEDPLRVGRVDRERRLRLVEVALDTSTFVPPSGRWLTIL